MLRHLAWTPVCVTVVATHLNLRLNLSLSLSLCLSLYINTLSQDNSPPLPSTYICPCEGKAIPPCHSFKPNLLTRMRPSTLFNVCVRARFTYYAWLKGRFNPSLFQKHPVDLFEEGMGLDGLFTPLGHHATQTLGWVLRHKLHTPTHTHTHTHPHTHTHLHPCEIHARMHTHKKNHWRDSEWDCWR